MGDAGSGQQWMTTATQGPNVQDTDAKWFLHGRHAEWPHDLAFINADGIIQADQLNAKEEKLKGS